MNFQLIRSKRWLTLLTRDIYFGVNVEQHMFSVMVLMNAMIALSSKFH